MTHFYKHPINSNNPYGHEPYTPETDWYIVAGIGDCLSIESWFTDEERSKVKRIHWSVRAFGPLMDLFMSNPVYRHVRHINHFTEGKPVLGAGDYGRLDPPNECPRGALSWAWLDSKDQDGMYRRLFNKPGVGSSFLRHQLADISQFNLPDRYVVIHPSTAWNAHDHRSERDLTSCDVQKLYSLLEERGEFAVVVNSPGAEPMPEHPLVIDLQGQTSLAESIEVLKGSTGYYGIDSWVSILACQLFDEERLIIKCKSAWYITCRKWYAFPHTKYNFLYHSIGGRRTYPQDH